MAAKVSVGDISRELRRLFDLTKQKHELAKARAWELDARLGAISCALGNFDAYVDATLAHDGIDGFGAGDP